MWFQFFITIVICGAILYLPGYFVLRVARFGWQSSIFFAPPITIALLQILFILYAKIGIQISIVTFLLPVLMVLVLCLIASRIFTHKRRESNLESRRYDKDLLSQQSFLRDGIWLSVMLLFSVMITGFVFVKGLDGPNSYSQLFDNAWHMGIIRNFIQSGDFSTLTSGKIVPTIGSTFYPTGWHSLVALVSLSFGVPLEMAANALNTFLIAIVFPLSMAVMLRQIFKENRRLFIVSSFFSLFFAAFPWRFITFGPLYSNLLSFSILPLAISIALVIFSSATPLSVRLRLSCLLVFTIIGVALSQPNAVFTFAIVIAPFIFTQVKGYVGVFQVSSERRAAVLRGSIYLGFSALIIVLWIFLYRASFMQRTVQWQWPAFVSKKQALIDVLFLGFHNAEPQILLGCLVALGVLYTIFNRRYLWLSASYAIFCVFYMLSASTESSAKAFLTGFWYHDSYRLGASAVLLAVGLAGVGANVLIIASQKLLNGIITNFSDEKSSALFTCIAVLAIAGVNFFPSYYLFERQTVVMPFGAIRRDITYTNSAKTPKSYTDEERKFVKRVKDIVGDSLVLNQPYDGSVYAYGADSLNVYYKAWEGNWMGLPTKDNELISKQLDQISNSASVQKAVKDSGSKYLMLLDRQDYRADPNDSSLILSDFQHYRRAVWAGLDAINDDTPGFQKIISQGNMRLYKIILDKE